MQKRREVGGGQVKDKEQQEEGGKRESRRDAVGAKRPLRSSDCRGEREEEEGKSHPDSWLGQRAE